MAISSNSSKALNGIVSYLFTRREAILSNWRMACDQDPKMSKISSLSREEFNNLLPIILNVLEQRLLGQPTEADVSLTARSHGLHRWQKSHALPDTMQELNYLTQTLYAELRTFLNLFPQTDAKQLFQAQQQIAELMHETMQGSVQKYDELQRLEAANRAAALQHAIDQMADLSRQRGDLLRTSSHDLKGSFGIINSAAYLLRTEELSEEDRTQFLDMLNRNLTKVESLLSSLMDLSRLESGEEVLHLEATDAALLLRDIVVSAQPMATERGLILQMDGPESLRVETDPIKLQRIMQNLLLNALKYTVSGFVSVSWSLETERRWVVSVQDSGPGLPETLTGLIALQLRPTVEMSPEEAEPRPIVPPQEQDIAVGAELGQQIKQSAKGEGVGLQIVKRLCELLDANLDVETKAGRGTLFRIRMPVLYKL